METRGGRRPPARGRNLETFLVEWKPYGCREVDRGLHALETFLVEWKLDHDNLLRHQGATLKPS